MKPVVFHPAALQEAEQAAAWYESQQPGLGRAFRVEFEAALGRIAENPQLYGVDLKDFRACPLWRFPYTIFYADLVDRIWLAAVAHQSRRPGYWSRRRHD